MTPALTPGAPLEEQLIEVADSLAEMRSNITVVGYTLSWDAWSALVRGNPRLNTPEAMSGELCANIISRHGPVAVQPPVRSPADRTDRKAFAAQLRNFANWLEGAPL